MTTADIRLRDVREDDRERLLAWRNSPDVAAFMYSDHKISQHEHDHWFDVVRHDARRRYWIIEVDGEPVGLANLADIDMTHRRCAWAYYLASPKVRGLGVGSFVEFQSSIAVTGIVADVVPAAIVTVGGTVIELVFAEFNVTVWPPAPAGALM